MATKIYIKHGTSTPTDADIAGPGELAIDVQNKQIYTKDLLNNVIMLGANVSGSTIDWSQLDNVPTEFKPEAHVHPISDVTGLQDALDDKTDAGHTHVIDDVTGLQNALDGKASVDTIICGTY